jgi:hypothetical protein
MNHPIMPYATYIARMRQENNTSEIQSDSRWESLARGILKAELARVGITYKGLAKRLELLGVADTEAAIANRISRGKFTFAFFLQCMKALGVAEVDVRDRAVHR